MLNDDMEESQQELDRLKEKIREYASIEKKIPGQFGVPEVDHRDH
jgi:hypothetical protein